MAKQNFSDFKARFSTATASGGDRKNNYYPFFKMPDESSARIRFVPDANEDNPLGFMIEKVTHQLKVNGENKTVPCLASYGEECPVCKVSKEYYDAGDKVNGKLYWKKKNYLAQALIMEDPIQEKGHENAEGQLKVFSIGFSIFKIIKDSFESGELDEAPFAYEGGTDFIIKKTKQGEFASYTLSKFARKSSDLTDEQIAVADEHRVDLTTLLPKKPELSTVEGLLMAALTGKAYDAEDAEDEDDTDSMKAMASKFKAGGKPAAADADDDTPAAPTRTAAPVQAAADESDEDAEALALLAELKAKREAAKRAAG